MPAKTTANISTQGQLRLFVQPGGPSVANPLLLAGVDLSYSQLTGVTNPRLGGVDPIQRFVPGTARQYQVAGKKVSAPKLPSWKWAVNEAMNGIPLPDIIGGCPTNFYEVKGNCETLSDPLHGWKGGNLAIYSGGIALDVDEGDRSSFDSDNELMQTLTFNGDAIYRTASIGVGAASIATLSDKLVKDVVYAPKQLCANCGTPNDGTQWLYGCTAAGTTSPGTKPFVIYSLDGGNTWTAVQVTSAAVAEDLIAIDIAAGYLFVVSKTGGGSSTSALHWAQIGATGAPGAWTKVTTGFVGGAPVNDVFVLTDNQIFFAADGGYIYKSTNVTAGVTVLTAAGVTSQNLLRIHGNNDVIFASGASSTLLQSNNNGNNWAAATAAPTAGAVGYTALFAVDAQKVWIGTDTGRLFGSIDGAKSWPSAYEITVHGSGGVVNDIQFATPEIGYYLPDTAVPAGRIFRTFNGGYSWANDDPSIVGLGSFSSLRRIAVPNVGATPSVLGKNFAVGGNNTTTAGLVLLGAARVF